VLCPHPPVRSRLPESPGGVELDLCAVGARQKVGGAPGGAVA
jgi:hypothetical protein